MDEDLVIRRALEIARTRFPGTPGRHAAFVASVLYLTSGGQCWLLPDLGHDGLQVWDLAVFRRFPSERLPESGVSFGRAVKMVVRSGIFRHLSTRHFRCWWEGLSGDNPSAVRAFSRGGIVMRLERMDRP